jgi:hypothetical protein
MSPASNTSGAPLPSVAVLGVDALLAARPATPVQLAHACQAAGYAAVYPVTWGDELLAAACARRVATRGDDPAIFCACPHVSDALLEVGSDLARFLVPLVSPPVACARYLRALYGYNRVRITYIGACPGAHDPAIDARLTPMQFLGVLTQLGIELLEQPEVFESVLPPDRRRHRSLPGGAPTSEILTVDGDTRALQEIIAEDWKTELAQRLLLKDRALFDLAPALGCHCAGARPGVPPAAARPSVVALEPPRASSDVIDLLIAVDVDRTLPLIVRSREVGTAVAVEPAPVPDEPRPEVPVEHAPPPAPAAATPSDSPTPPPASPPPDAGAVAEEEARRRKAAAPVVARAAQTVPLARTEGGQILPRAYAARRRTPADGGVAIAPPTGAPAESAVEVSPASAVEPAPVVDPPAPEPAAPEAAAVNGTEPDSPPRPTPRSVTVPLPAEDLRPVPPAPAADHARAAIITAAATVAVALTAFVTLRKDDGRVTTESSGIAAPAPTVLDSLPPLTFPLPDTTAASAPASTDTASPPPSTPAPDSAPRQNPPRVAVSPPPLTARPAPTRPRRRAGVARRSRADSIALARAAARRVADSVEREGIRQELALRRARLDSIERSLEPDRPHR